MASISLYFQVHQPYRIKKYRVFDIGNSHSYFNDDSESDLNNEVVLHRVVEKSYAPTNQILLDLLKRHPEFKISFSITGVMLEQLSLYFPHVLSSFKRLVDTGKVELLSETYHHSLAFLFSPEEFKRQVQMQNSKIKEIFGVEPAVFRNTELIYNNDLATAVSELGFSGVLAEASKEVLDGLSSGFVYEAGENSNLKILLKDTNLSEEISSNFSHHHHSGKALTANRFVKMLSKRNHEAELINLFMDYQVFGEHHSEDTGIHKFLDQLPAAILHNSNHHFVTPSESIENIKVSGNLNIPHYVSWSEIGKDLTSWSSNSMQRDALQKLYSLEQQVLASNNSELINDWRRLQTSDHFYYMCTEWFKNEDLHTYFNPYESPYEAFIAFMNVLEDFKHRMGIKTKLSIPQEVKVEVAVA